tara:strand:+ start:16409 stop:16534 length:126 start_codon:yes stop_codon:yes gene_type:complete
VAISKMLIMKSLYLSRFEFGMIMKDMKQSLLSLGNEYTDAL